MNSVSPFFNQSLGDLDAWMNHFLKAPIPVLEETALTLERLRDNEDAVDANMLGEIIGQDPLMTLKVMAYASTHRHARLETDTETVTACLVMMGISPFFAAFPAQIDTATFLKGDDEAVEGLHSMLHRARRAASFALAFAVHRTDPDAAVIHQAALLHDTAEMLMACHAPALVQRVRAAQMADPQLRSVDAQQAVYGVSLQALQLALMKAWRLPELLQRMSNDQHGDHDDQVRCVRLGVQLSRHTGLRGWDDPAVPDDIQEVSQLLQLSPDAVVKLLHDIDD